MTKRATYSFLGWIRGRLSLTTSHQERAHTGMSLPVRWMDRALALAGGGLRRRM